MPHIDTLIPDVQKLLKRKDGWFTDELASSFSTSLAKTLQTQLGEEHHSVGKKREYLWFGELGPRCPKALWHKFNTPELAEALPAGAEFKYTFGHIIEALAITLAKAAGHTVEGEQDRVTVSLDGSVAVSGRRDCVIDGCLVDVKSASSFSFQKFRDKSIKDSDTFGYLDQLDGYMVGGADDPIVQLKDKAYLWAIDKQLGHMCLYEHTARNAQIIERIREYTGLVRRSTPPDCACRSIPDGKSGNLKLDTAASYNTFKYCCNPLLRTFIYSNGPVFLTKVVRQPNVPEVDKHGKIVYNVVRENH